MHEQPSDKATTSPYGGVVRPGLVRLGAWAWVLGSVQSFALQLIVGAAWPEPYSWAANNISDLGNVGCGAWDGRHVCSPLHAWMNASFVAQGLLLVVGLALTGPLWRGGSSGWAWRALVLLAGAAWVVVGLAPADVNLGPHLLAALVVFFLGNASLLLAANPGRGSGMHAIRPYSLTLGVVGLVSAVLFLGGQDLGLGLGTLERLAVFPLQVWALLVGIYILRRVKR